MVKEWVYSVLGEHGNCLIGNATIKRYGIAKIEKELSDTIGYPVVIETKVHRKNEEIKMSRRSYRAKDIRDINYIATVLK